MKLLVDLNLSYRWVDILNQAGIEAAHWSALGSLTAKDVEIMAFALKNNYVVLTQDLDFGAILATTQGAKPSVVQIRSEVNRPEIIGESVLAALHQMERQLMEGALLTIDPDRTRIRFLPLFPEE